MQRRWFHSLTIAVILLSVAAWLNFLIQERLIYAPARYAADDAPSPWALEYETSAGRQTAFYAPPACGGAPGELWLMFGGNGSLALDWRPVVAANTNPARAFLLLDYPGFGRCAGHPSPSAIQESADRALTVAREHWGGAPAPLRVCGYSLGTGPALQFAARHAEVENILLLAPFTSLGEVEKFLYGVRTDFLLLHRFDNRAAVTALAARPAPPALLILHGENDDTVPLTMGRQLAALLPGAVFRRLPGVGHDGVCQTPLILECMNLATPMN
ncbi:MAG: alpha/beta hydrolase [Verrucomicrobiales bacterium]|jgi:pimeloyl-ACP methyl ester carboxylesterase|nr:alpha/beta hydrolase [Verrucomicrobiales bacterium]